MKKFNLFLIGFAFLYCSSSMTYAQNSTESTKLFNEIDNSLKELNIEMVTCPAGSFLMGSPKTELGRLEPDENSIWFNSDVSVKETQHKVTLTKSFQIAKFELTQKQYNSIMSANPSEFKGDDLPVTNITKKDAEEFCNKLNEKFSKVLPKGYKFDLPTEAQWEYACRAGTTTALNNNKVLTTIEGKCPNLDEVAWYRGNTEGRSVHQVGLKKPNAWGIYDMHGNVCEICKDEYQDYSEEDVVDPFGKKPATRIRGFLYKGGDCRSIIGNCRSASRIDFQPRQIYANSYMGMRLAIVSAE